MTVRLLADYDRYPANAIVTLDAGTEAGLIAAKRALADTTGGVPLAPVSGAVQSRVGAFTVRIGRAETIILTEGQALTVVGASGAIGTVSLLDASGAVVGTPWTVGTGALPPIGPYSGSRKLVLACTAASIDAVVVDAVLNAPSQSNNPQGTPFRLMLPDGRSVAARRVGRKGKVVLDGSDKTQWGFVFATGGGEVLNADPVNKQFSSQGLSINCGTTATQGVKRTLASTFAIASGSIIRINIYIPLASYAGAQTFTIKFSSDANATKSLQYVFTNAYVQPGWNTLTVRAGEDGTYEPQAGGAWTAAGGQAWGDNFNYFHIWGNALVANQPWVFDSVTVGAKDIPRFVYTTDGLDPSILNIIAPMMAAYGWAGTSMIDGDAATVAAWSPTAKKLISQYGWEIGCQGITHTSYNSNGRDIGADWDTCVANFLAAGLPAPKTFAYPLNAQSASNDAILAARGCLWRRGGGLDILHNSAGFVPGMVDGMVRQGCNAHSAQNYNTGTNYAQIKNRLDHLKLVGGVMSSFVHNESLLAADWALGGDLSQFGMILDQLFQMQQQDGLEVLLASQLGAALKQSVHY